METFKKNEKVYFGVCPLCFEPRIKNREKEKEFYCMKCRMRYDGKLVTYNTALMLRQKGFKKMNAKKADEKNKETKLVLLVFFAGIFFSIGTIFGANKSIEKAMEIGMKGFGIIFFLGVIFYNQIKKQL